MLLHCEDLVFDHLHDREIAVDDEVQDGVQDEVRPHLGELGASQKFFVSVSLHAIGGMAHRDDVAPADECVDLAVLDCVVLQARQLQHDEDLIVVEVDLRDLRRLHRVLDSEAM